MKKLLCIFTISLLIVNCGSEEQGATHNASDLDNKRIVTQEITLEEISSYYGDEQKEIFGLLTPENKKRLWEEKFENLLSLTDNEDEMLLLNRIYDEVKKMDFSESLEDDDQEIVVLNNLVAEGISMFD